MGQEPPHLTAEEASETQREISALSRSWLLSRTRIQTQALGVGPRQQAGQPGTPGSPRPFPSHTAIWDDLLYNGHLKVRFGQTLAHTISLVSSLQKVPWNR